MRYGAMLGVAITCWLATGCCNTYERTKTGKTGGKYSLVWVSADKFLYVPDETDPFYFERPDGRRIVPDKMYTDGGSIPRQLWSLRNYSPWSYGPAFLIHDWLFVAHDCGPAEYQTYTVDESADVMAEVMKTLMVEQKAPHSASTLNLMHWAVSTSIAKSLWDAPSECEVGGGLQVTGRRFAHGRLPTTRASDPPLLQAAPQPYRISVDLNGRMPD